MEPRIAMKAAPIAVAFGMILGAASADTIQLPKDKAAITAAVPDAWEAKESGDGILAESPDREVVVYFELVGSDKPLNSITDGTLKWLAEDFDVIADLLTKKEKDVEESSRQWNRIFWSGNSKAWGPTLIGLCSTDAGDGKTLIITYWIAKMDNEKSLETLGKVFASVSPAN